MSQIENDERSDATEDELETLIGRVIDREAGPRDMKRIEQLAATDASVWRTLAQRQLDMAALSDKVVEQTAAADRVEPRPAPPRRRLRWAAAISGWAAVLVIMGAWWMTDGPARMLAARAGTEPAAGSGAVPGGTSASSYDQVLKQYLQAPFVVGQYDIVVRQHEDLEGGRHRIFFLRRIEEFIDIDTPPQAVIDQRGKLRVDPAKLREQQQARRARGS